MINVQFNNQSTATYSRKFFINIVKIAARCEKKLFGTVEVNVVESADMKKLNRVYRGKNNDTDVLSFAWKEDKMVKSDLLGQIYLCHERVKRQAKEFEVSEEEEMARMLVHGLLHLVGYDHGAPKQAKKMFALQEKIVQLCQFDQ